MTMTSSGIPVVLPGAAIASEAIEERHLSPEVLMLIEAGTELTEHELAAVQSANDPSGDNPLATMEDLPVAGSQADVATLYEQTLSANANSIAIDGGTPPEGAWAGIFEILVNGLTEGRAVSVSLWGGAIRRYEEHAAGVASPLSVGTGTSTHILQIASITGTSEFVFYGAAGSCFIRVRRIGWM